MLSIRDIGSLAGLGLREAFTTILKHERNTSGILMTASSAVLQCSDSMDGPDVIPRTISGPHSVSTRDFVIEHILGIFPAGESAGLGLRVATFTIKQRVRDTVAVAVTSVGTLC